MRRDVLDGCRPRAPFRSVLAFAGLMVALSACGSPGDGPGGDTGTAQDSGADAAGDAEGDSASDTAEDTGPARCVPGQTRCLDTGQAAYETCSDTGEWIVTFCVDDQICFEGACAERICEPFTVTSCEDCRSYVGCNAGGTAEGTFNVPLDRTCVEEGGVASLVPSECFPGATRCSPDVPDDVERCDECGQSWERDSNCFEEDPATVCDLGTCITQCEFIRKRESYIGCEYWAVDLDNALVPGGTGVLDADGKPFAVVIANPSTELTTEVEIAMVDGVVHRASIPPGELHIAKLHIWEGSGEGSGEGTPMADIQGTQITPQAFRVTASLPIIAYQFNPLDNEIVYSNDASLLFPTSTLGTEYWVMTRRQTFDSLKGYVTVVAVLEGETEVTVTLPPYTLENPVVTLPASSRDCQAGPDRERLCIPTMRGGDTRTFMLRQYDVLNIETNRRGADLTGTRVESNRPVAVFGGVEAANAPNDDSCVYRPVQDDWVCEATRRSQSPRPCSNADGEPDISLCSDFITCCADHIEHQMLPDFAWGRRFAATRTKPRGDEAESWRILASRDGTNVTLSGLPDSWWLPDMLPIPARREFTLDAGGWVDFQSPVDFEIDADGPIMVGQFLHAEQAPYPGPIDGQMPAHQDAGTGDPAFVLVAPVEQYRTDYTFLAPEGFEFDFATITAPADAEVTLNGALLEETDFTTFGSEEFKVARVQVEDGVHRVSSDVPFGLVVYGYDSYVSYGYTGGLDLRRLDGR